MKKIIGLLFVAFAIMACNKMPKDAVILSGKVENAKELKELKIVNNKGFSKVLKLNADGSFLDTIKLKKSGDFMIPMGRGGFKLYLMPEDNLKITLDLKNKENPLKFIEGKAVVVNQFIQKEEKKDSKKIEEIGGVRALFSMNEDDFLKFLDENNKEKVEAFNTAKDLPKDFVEFYDKFHEDSVFQIEHITFPLEGATRMPNSDIDSMIPYKWRKENWKIHKKFENFDDIFTRSFYLLGDDAVIENIIGVDSLFQMQRRFSKLHSGWHLIYYYEN